MTRTDDASGEQSGESADDADGEPTNEGRSEPSHEAGADAADRATEVTTDEGTDARDVRREDDGSTAGTQRTDAASAPSTETIEGGTGMEPPAESTEFGWRGWVVVGALVVSLVVVPWTIIALPQASGFLESLGLGWRDAYLVLPLVPALGLGALAVWAAVANRRPG